MQRLNDSETQFVTSSDDGTIRIWDIRGDREQSDDEKPKTIKKLQFNTDVVEPRHTLTEHENNVKLVKMNSHYLVSYSDDESRLIVRDWELRPIVTISNLGQVLNLVENTRINNDPRQGF